MDEIDNKLFTLLDKNPRAPLSQLAKKILVSQQVADYRLKKMIENGIILKFGTIINLRSLGLEHYRVFLQLNSKNEYSHSQIFQYLKNKKGVYWVARIGGKYDLALILFLKSFKEFDDFMDDFHKKFPDLIKNYINCHCLDHYIYQHKYATHDYAKIHYGLNDLIVPIDKLDYNILLKMKDNCRISSLEIAKEEHVSYKTVNRIKLLEKKKVILGYRIYLQSTKNLKTMKHKQFIILLYFRNYSKLAEEKLMSYIATNEYVTQTIRMFGIWNIFLHVRIEDNEKLQELMIDLRAKFDIIDTYELIPVFEDIAINMMPV